MNRLTMKNKDGGIVQPPTTSWNSVFLKLAWYEDTGLEPEEVMALKDGNYSAKAPEEKTGEWITFKDEEGRFRKKCSSCGYQMSRSGKSTKYCPECGAKMLDAV